MREIWPGHLQVGPPDSVLQLPQRSFSRAAAPRYVKGQVLLHGCPHEHDLRQPQNQEANTHKASNNKLVDQNAIGDQREAHS